MTGNKMEILEKKKPNRTKNKNVGIRVNEATFEAFNIKLQEDGIDKQYMLETAIYRYIHGLEEYKKD